MKKIIGLAQLLRPHQWLKNGFVFLPVFFSGNILNGNLWTSALIAFIAFSFAASSIYCLNDLKDVKADRAHPVKCKRPIATCVVSKSEAIGVFIILTAAWIALTICSSDLQSIEYADTAEAKGAFGLTAVIAVYVLLNIAYCFKLKKVAIFDVFIIATGFVMRLVAGGITTDIWLSPWIICLTFLLSLFLAFAKRRDDVVLRETKGIKVRKNIEHYNLAFLNQTLGVLAAVTLVSYIMYTVSPEVTARLHTDYLYITSVFVLAGILRYLQVAIVGEKSGSPTKILMHDRFTQFCILGWITCFVVIIYL